ncbi:hypothetical protein [Streptomyces sp. SD15]
MTDRAPLRVRRLQVFQQAVVAPRAVDADKDLRLGRVRYLIQRGGKDADVVARGRRPAVPGVRLGQDGDDAVSVPVVHHSEGHLATEAFQFAM